MNATTGNPDTVQNTDYDTTEEIAMTDTTTTPDWRAGTTAVYRLTDWITCRPAGNETADEEALDRFASDVAEILGQLKQATAVAEVWYFTDDDEDSSPEVYLDADAAKDAAVRLYASEYDPAELADGKFTWREFTPRGMSRSHWLLDHGGVFTGWSVDRIQVAAPAAEAGAQ